MFAVPFFFFWCGVAFVAQALISGLMQVGAAPWVMGWGNFVVAWGQGVFVNPVHCIEVVSAYVSRRVVALAALVGAQAAVAGALRRAAAAWNYLRNHNVVIVALNPLPVAYDKFVVALNVGALFFGYPMPSGVDHSVIVTLLSFLMPMCDAKMQKTISMAAATANVTIPVLSGGAPVSNVVDVLTRLSGMTVFQRRLFDVARERGKEIFFRARDRNKEADEHARLAAVRSEFFNIRIRNTLPTRDGWFLGVVVGIVEEFLIDEVAISRDDPIPNLKAESVPLSPTLPRPSMFAKMSVAARRRWTGKSMIHLWVERGDLKAFQCVLDSLRSYGCCEIHLARLWVLAGLGVSNPSARANLALVVAKLCAVLLHKRSKELRPVKPESFSAPPSRGGDDVSYVDDDDDASVVSYLSRVTGNSAEDRERRAAEREEWEREFARQQQEEIDEALRELQEARAAQAADTDNLNELAELRARAEEAEEYYNSLVNNWSYGEFEVPLPPGGGRRRRRQSDDDDDDSDMSAESKRYQQSRPAPTVSFQTAPTAPAAPPAPVAISAECSTHNVGAPAPPSMVGVCVKVRCAETNSIATITRTDMGIILAEDMLWDSPVTKKAVSEFSLFPIVKNVEQANGIRLRLSWCRHFGEGPYGFFLLPSSTVDVLKYEHNGQKYSHSSSFGKLASFVPNKTQWPKKQVNTGPGGCVLFRVGLDGEVVMANASMEFGPTRVAHNASTNVGDCGSVLAQAVGSQYVAIAVHVGTDRTGNRTHHPNYASPLPPLSSAAMNLIALAEDKAVTAKSQAEKAEALMSSAPPSVPRPEAALADSSDVLAAATQAANSVASSGGGSTREDPAASSAGSSKTATEVSNGSSTKNPARAK